MRLNFDSFEFDAAGLPRVYSLRVTPNYTGTGPVIVSILLDSCRRSAVEKWAKRLGVEVVDCKPHLHSGGDRVTYTYEATLQADGCRVRVWTSFDQDVPAEAADETAMHWPAPGLRTTTMCDGEPLTREAFAVNASDVTCPQCRALLPAEPGGGAS